MIEFANVENKEQQLTAYLLLLKLSRLHCGLWSTEKASQPASGSELRRWIVKSSLEINGHTDIDPNEVIDYPVVSVVIHPKSKKLRNTLMFKS